MGQYLSYITICWILEEVNLISHLRRQGVFKKDFAWWAMGIYLGSFSKRKCKTLAGLLFLQVSFASQRECSQKKIEFNLGQVNSVSHFMIFYRLAILKSAKTGRIIL